MKGNMKNNTELHKLCNLIKELSFEGKFDLCINEISAAMEQFPHAPQPHNLMGIVLEKLGDHVSAMKHFRAAWALDPTYLPAKHNLNAYGTFFSPGKCAFDENDVPKEPQKNRKIQFDEHGIRNLTYNNIKYIDHTAKF